MLAASEAAMAKLYSRLGELCREEFADWRVAILAPEAPLADQSVEFLAKLQQLGSLISALKTEYRTLEKKWTRELKASQKQSVKRKRKAGNRAPSGFVKPTLISDELAAFLGKDKGTELARTAVSKEINAYIRAAKLQDPTNGRKINPDAKLAKLLKLAKGDELTYFNLQKYMKHHFIKTVVAPVTV
jgi:chromatin remodeling complex protein RSC6